MRTRPYARVLRVVHVPSLHRYGIRTVCSTERAQLAAEQRTLHRVVLRAGPLVRMEPEVLLVASAFVNRSSVLEHSTEPVHGPREHVWLRAVHTCECVDNPLARTDVPARFALADAVRVAHGSPECAELLEYGPRL